MFIAGVFVLWAIWTQPISDNGNSSNIGRFTELALFAAVTLFMGYVALTGRAGRFRFSQTDASTTQKKQAPNVLLVRLYLDGRVTLDGSEVMIDELNEPFRFTAINGGAVWIYAEDLDQNKIPNSHMVLEKLSTVNLPFLFATNEDFSDVSVSKEEQIIKPTNLLYYQPGEEYSKYVVSEQETLLYLAALQLHMVGHCNELDCKGDFHVVVALRPNESRIWLILPENYSDASFEPLLQSLRNQPLPAISGGIVAFAVSMEFPVSQNNEKTFDIPLPKEWKMVIESAGKEEMPATDLLNIVWPVDSH
jgi:hypothetical protein